MAINHVYGPILSFVDILDARETSLVTIAALVPQDVQPQLRGHVKGAVANGATAAEVAAALEISQRVVVFCKSLQSFVF